MRVASGGQQMPTYPRTADHGRMRAKDEPAQHLIRSAVVMGTDPLERERQGGIDQDQVGLLSHLERADAALKTERFGATQRSEAEPVGGTQWWRLAQSGGPKRV